MPLVILLQSISDVDNLIKYAPELSNVRKYVWVSVFLQVTIFSD